MPMRVAIFLCNNETMSECHTLSLFGTNEPYGRSVVRGDLCLLYNYSDNGVYGVWEATTPCGTYERQAWHGRYPHQVRIKQASERIILVPRPQIQSLLGDRETIGRIYDGYQSQEILQHYAHVYHVQVMQGVQGRQTEEDYRNRFPANFFCEDGHRVRSQGEKIIDDWLHRHGVRHAYEPVTAIPGQLITDFLVYCRSGDRVAVEYR